MTLRVTFMVHPPADALRDPHKIYEVVVAQRGERAELPVRDYDWSIYEHNQAIPTGMAGRVLRVGTGVIEKHTRSDHALELVRRVLEDHLLKE